MKTFEKEEQKHPLADSYTSLREGIELTSSSLLDAYNQHGVKKVPSLLGAILYVFVPCPVTLSEDAFSLRQQGFRSDNPSLGLRRLFYAFESAIDLLKVRSTLNIFQLFGFSAVRLLRSWRYGEKMIFQCQVIRFDPKCT